MRTTRIDIEGPQGRATIRREERKIVITGTRVMKVIERHDGQGMPIGEAFQLQGKADNHDANVVVARMLHKYLEGYAGTNGDVFPYVDAIWWLVD